MSAIDYYVGVWKKYADFSGRARRSEYWYFALFNMLAAFATMAIDAVIGYPATYFLYVLAALIPGIAVAVRRLHDTNRSGWWILIAFIPLIGAIILIVFLATEGTAGTNDHGSDPKNPDAPGDDISEHLVD